MEGEIRGQEGMKKKKKGILWVWWYMSETQHVGG